MTAYLIVSSWHDTLNNLTDNQFKLIKRRLICMQQLYFFRDDG